MAEPTRARAVLSTQDFQLLKEAVLFYLRHHDGEPQAEKFSHLYHRLGSAARQ